MAFRELRGPHVISVFTHLPLPPLYATDNGTGRIVTVEEGRHSSKQTWWLQPVEGKQDVYTITVGKVAPKIGTPGFRREIDRGSDDVINSPLRGEWYFVPVTKHGLEVYEVHSSNHIIGVEELLATEGDNVVVKIYPVGPEPLNKPAWRFIPILRD